jgi:arylsulfatase A-like enzyme
MRTITLPLCVALTATFAHAAPPNIILINADDLGYADLGCYGSTLHRTPRLDQLAKEGVRFTNFYDAANVCSPSRTALMTGCYPKRLGMEQGYPHGIVLFPGDHRGLNPKEVTIARVLRSAGYSTECIGKWHLGDQPIFLPTRHGFDEYFGIPFSNDMGQTERPKNAKPYPPLPFLKYEVVVEQEPDQRYLTTHYTSEAIRFISVNKDKPFFIYLAHSMPHFPQFSSENFAGKSKNGRWGDAVEEIDFETGRLLDYLKQQKLDGNTIVLFTSDNGGPTQQGAHNEPLRMGKGSTWEGGHRVPLIVRWPGHVPPGSVCHELAVNFDIPVTLAKIAGSTMPTDRILDGRDITDLLTHPDTAKTKHEAFFYY